MFVAPGAVPSRDSSFDRTSTSNAPLPSSFATSSGGSLDFIFSSCFAFNFLNNISLLHLRDRLGLLTRALPTRRSGIYVVRLLPPSR